ncbi:MJ0144 family RNA dihydrouridine synthase-like protein [uncultured Methanobrevibacter sp.]|uniref:MJ0144 family RNA dihydrouridine synthase-like protein n=1 Tax=uncultured Methanobrevibacter sp. TaxID=253161 RepID=UPI0025E817D7|nr:MJ0144 family RNA dihydrouridine synthase-like protein [uncultured Methanobrevibacter sp.]
MAGITDAEFLNKVIPYGFDVVTLGGYSLDEKTIEASRKIIERGRKEFHFELDEIIPHIEKEVNLIKKACPDVRVSANVRSTTAEPIIEASKISDLDIIEVNCHCRQEEITAIGCGQEMLKRPDFSDYISQIVDGSKSEVSVKIRGNVPDIDTLEVAKIIEDAGANYLHLDAMDPNVFDADWKLLENVCNNTNIKVIGNNSIDSAEKIRKMYQYGVYGFSIARAVISGTLNFDISNF